jgi:hypothetical protein
MTGFPCSQALNLFWVDNESNHGISNIAILRCYVHGQAINVQIQIAKIEEKNRRHPTFAKKLHHRVWESTHPPAPTASRSLSRSLPLASERAHSLSFKT